MWELSFISELAFTVTNPQLLVTKYVTLILLFLIFGGLFLNLLQLAWAINYRTRIRKAIYSIILFALIFPVYSIYQFESSLLASDKYVPGTTVGFCSEFALGAGVEFDYVVNGVKYTNCNTFHPIPMDSIIVPDGKYLVRYTEKYPDRGRIDLRKPVIIKERNESLAHELSKPLKARLTKPIPSKQ